MQKEGASNEDLRGNLSTSRSVECVTLFSLTKTSCLNVQHELLALIDDFHLSLKAELTIDPSYVIGAQCLDKLIQHRQAAVVVARSILNKPIEPHRRQIDKHPTWDLKVAGMQALPGSAGRLR
jgi:hypothetical protein